MSFDQIRAHISKEWKELRARHFSIVLKDHKNKIVRSDNDLKDFLANKPPHNLAVDVP